ncbi:MAG: DUF4037 domain-containing protein [Chloroflexi bacterium]|nr:DUF4037 domain-containing protein [Chloroflexota bacterium]OJV95220.1 MAG: hypothetical protein BGO39_24750 [Chloroflexi bacterium 54-19]
MTIDPEAAELAQRLTAAYSRLPETVAIAWGGSQTNNLTDQYSDLDIYIYQKAEIALQTRSEIAATFADEPEIGNNFFESGDEFVDRKTGLGVDLIFRSPDWVEGELTRVLKRHQASIGYSTAIWYNVLNYRTLYDPEGWLARLLDIARQPYPEELRRAIIAKNYPLLRENQSSYQHQIEKSLTRRDKISYNHRVAVLLASYFDVLFAFNRQPHPGEKRLIPLAKKLCPHLPASFEADLDAWLVLPPIPENIPSILRVMTHLLDELDILLQFGPES